MKTTYTNPLGLGLISLLCVAGCSSTSPTKSTESVGTAVAPSTPSAPSTQPSAGDREISAEFPFDKKFVEVNGNRMAYVDEGSGPTVLFIHGNPTSSYLWRNIIPYAAKDHRAIAIDLIGMGDSSKPDIEYSFADQSAYLDGFIEALDLKDITLVIHDWGSALGFHYARRHQDNVRGIAFMEAVIPPIAPLPSYEAMGEMGGMFRQLRTEGVGEKMVLEQNIFIEELLRKVAVKRTLTEEEMAHYRRPYPTQASRAPLLMWPREVPIGGEPADTHKAIAEYGAWAMDSEMPKLYLHAQPGMMNPEPVVDFVKAKFKNTKVVDIGEGLHFIQEDRPHEIGEALVTWLDTL